MARRSRPRVVWAAIAAAAAIAFGGIWFWWPKYVAQHLFAGTKSVTLSTQPYDQMRDDDLLITERITDQPQIAEIISAIRLRPKRICECAHFQRLVFATPRRPIEVEVCDHCFDVKGHGHYQMPPELWRVLEPKFKRLEEKAAKRSRETPSESGS